MGKNSKSNEKNTWMISVALAPFLLLCAFSSKILRISPNPPMRAAPERISSSLQKSSHTYIYHLLNPKSVPKRKILLFPLFSSSFFLFLNLPIQKQSSQFQIPLQNLPKRAPPSLNSNGKFPCKKT